MIKLGQSLGNFMEQFLGLFQSLLIGTKCKLANKNLMNFFMIITIVVIIDVISIIISGTTNHALVVGLQT